MTREQFLVRWCSRKNEFAQLGALVSGSEICAQVLADFENVLRSMDDELVTLREAANRSGYSTDHLRRLHRKGQLAAERRGRRLYFRSAALPKKPPEARLTSSRSEAYDPVADARQVATRRHRGAAHG